MFDYSGKLLCYCVHSADKFRSWLKERYGSLEKLNDVWFRHYTSWEKVMPPSRFGTSSDMMDWRRFWLHNLAQWLRARVAAAKEAAPGMRVQTHTAFSGYMGAENEGGLGNELGDEFLLAREVDAFGLSSFPLWLMGEKHVTGHLINVEIIAESSREKPFYQMELQGGAGKKGLLGGIVPSAEDIRLWNLNVIAAGGKGIVYWQFKPEPAGLESPGFGLVNPDGSDTPRSISAAECARRFSREDLANAHRVLPQNGIYLSRSSDLLTYSVGEESKYNASFKGIYHLLLDKGIPVRFIHEDYLDKALDEGLKVLYLPMCLSLSAREKQLLAGFARKGGTLVVEGCTGMYNEHGELDPYFTFLDSLFGMRNVWIEAIPGDHAYVRTLNGSRSIGFMLYRQLFEKVDDGCMEIARFDDGKTAALARTVEDGKAIWVSGFAGMEYNSTGHPETGDFMASLFAYPGYPAIEKMESQGMLVRMHEDNSHYYIVAVNSSNADKSLFVKMKNGRTAEAVVRARDGEVLKVGKP
jgi:beta-galactosidase GanA